MARVFTQGITVDYSNPGEEFPEVVVTFTILANYEANRLPSIDDIAEGLIMLGKMTDNEEAFEAEARKWLEKEKEEK